MERKYKLMLVDDEPWALTGIEEIIDWKAEGFTVVTRCGCGRDGILDAQIHQPDAVVTDIRMPDMSGLEMIRQIREIPVPAECVIVSAYSDFEVAREAIRLSAVHYLLKAAELTGCAGSGLPPAGQAGQDPPPGAEKGPSIADR